MDKVAKSTRFMDTMKVGIIANTNLITRIATFAQKHSDRVSGKVYFGKSLEKNLNKQDMLQFYSPDRAQMEPCKLESGKLSE